MLKLVLPHHRLSGSSRVSSSVFICCSFENLKVLVLCRTAGQPGLPGPQGEKGKKGQIIYTGNKPKPELGDQGDNGYPGNFSADFVFPFQKLISII